MIEDPPLLTLKTAFERPTPEAISALTGASTGVVVDCLDGHGASSIKPLTPDTVGFCGTVVTCDCGPADNLAVFAALKIVQPGDVIVIATSAYTHTAVIGDMVVGMAGNNGVAAIVTDGYVRDINGICSVGIPCFAAGVTPNSPARNGPGTAGLPITIDGIYINSGDIIVGDTDGFVVVPNSRINAVLERLPVVLKAESDLDAQVKDGLKMPEFVNEVFDSDKVRYLD